VAERFPEHIALVPDPSMRRSADGRTLLGGSPLRLLRFTDAGATAVDRVLAGGEVAASGADAQVARRLLDAGMAHPRPRVPPVASLSVVIPVRDHAEDLGRLLACLPGTVPDGTEVVVVDDGSADEGAVTDAVAGRALLMRHDRSGGPGRARDTGWRASSGEVVVFVDADVQPQPSWLQPLLAHLADPTVGVVAPRVRSRPGPTLRERYERHRSPLDLGPREARVAPRSRVSYVPTAALACRRRTLEALGGFDPQLRVGEDVDLVWRAVEAGWTVRYEPASVVLHRPRPTWSALLRQRRTYGSAAAALERRHPGAVAPVELNAWSLLAWSLPLAGRRGAAAGAAVALGSALALAPRLEGRVEDPVATALRLGGLGTLNAGTWLGRAVWRAWLPLALAASVPSRRVRTAVVAAAVLPALLDRRAVAPERVEVDTLRWIALHAVDQAAYCAGVWEGALAERSPRALLPRLSGIPGLVPEKSGTRRPGG
jgi:mycofactocin system glycosyltransferase